MQKIKKVLKASKNGLLVKKMLHIIKQKFVLKTIQMAIDFATTVIQYFEETVKHFVILVLDGMVCVYITVLFNSILIILLFDELRRANRTAVAILPCWVQNQKQSLWGKGRELSVICKFKKIPTYPIF